MRDRKPGNCSCACKGATLQLVPHFLSVETENPATGQPVRLSLALQAQQSITGNRVQAPAMKASRTGASAARVADGRVLIRVGAGVERSWQSLNCTPMVRGSARRRRPFRERNTTGTFNRIRKSLAGL